MLRTGIIALALLSVSVPAAMAVEIAIRDGKTQPENLSIAPSGDLLVGSFAAPRIDIIKRGTTTAETFVDLTAEGPGSILGVLVDGASNTLWACNLVPRPGGRTSNLRGFDLKTGKQKLRWDLPGETSICNDVSVGPGNTLYIADTTGKLYRLPAGAQAGELVLEGELLRGIDGIAFLNGVLYFNNIYAGKFYRLPLDAAGKAGAPVEIALDVPLTRPDGMRAGNGKLYVGEGGGGRVVSLTLTGDTARVTVLKEGLQGPLGVQPAGDVLWFIENRAGRLSSISIPK